MFGPRKIWQPWVQVFYRFFKAPCRRSAKRPLCMRGGWGRINAHFSIPAPGGSSFSAYLASLTRNTGSPMVRPSVTRDRCYDLKNSFAKKFSKKMAFLTRIKAKLCQILIITLFLRKNPIFSLKIVKHRRKL
jgi:hypothetical protein